MQSCKAESVKMRRTKCEDATGKGADARAWNCKREWGIVHVISLLRLRSFASFTLVVFNSLLLSVRMNYLFCSKLFQACSSAFYSSPFPRLYFSAKVVEFPWANHSMHLGFYNSQFRPRLHTGTSGLCWLILFFKWNDISRIVSFLRTCWNLF